MAVNTTNKDLKKEIKSKNLQEEKSANFVGWYASTTISQSSGAIIEPYLPLFAQSIGASNSEIGILAGLFSLINISQLIWAQLSYKFGNNKNFVFFGQILTALFFIPIAFLKLGQFILLLIIRFAQGLFNSATIPTLATLKSDYISDENRASKITKFTYLGLLGSFIGTLLGGFLFDYFSTVLSLDETYTLLFIFTAIIGLMGTSLFFLSVPNSSKTPINQDTLSPISYINRDLQSMRKSQISAFKRFKGYLRKFRSFWIFTIFGVIFYFGVYTVSPFFIIIEINHFHFSFFQASILTSISIIAQISISITLSKYNLMNKYGRKPYLLLGVILILSFTVLFAIPYYLINSLTTEFVFYYCLASWVILGLGWGFFNSTIAVLLLDIAHPQYRSLLIAVFNSCTGLVMFLGPVSGGFLIDYTNDLFFPFIIRFTVVLIALIYLIRFINEPEISGIELKPLKNVFPFFTRMSSTRGPELGIAYGNEKLARKKHF